MKEFKRAVAKLEDCYDDQHKDWTIVRVEIPGVAFTMFKEWRKGITLERIEALRIQGEGDILAALSVSKAYGTDTDIEVAA